MIGTIICLGCLLLLASGAAWNESSKRKLTEQKNLQLNQTLNNLRDENSRMNRQIIGLLTSLKENRDALELLKSKIPDMRADAVQQSKRVITGQTYQHLAPFETQGYDPRDFKFIGEPIDFVIFAGLTALKAGTADEISEVLICDVKTGSAGLNKNQRRIRDCIEQGRVRFLVLDKEA